MSLPFDNIPLELKGHPNWVMWNREERDGKLTKVPYTLAGKRADPANPDTWSGFPSVKWASERVTNKVSGIGFVFSEDIGIVGIDFDHVRNSDTGEWNPEALAEMKKLNSYTELSPSGTGCHVYVKGKIPKDGRRKKQPDGTDREMYQNKHFFTVTGNKVEGFPDTINEAQVNEFYKKWFGEDKKSIPEKKTEKKLSDSYIIDIASKAKNSDKFKRLFNGDTTGYDSQSNADLALCSLLAFYTQDAEQIDTIFRSSKLYRDKWEREDYKERTTATAIAGVTETYNGKATENSPVYKELTDDEIKLLGAEFAERHLICDLPDNHFISQMVKYSNRMTDAFFEYKILAALWLLSCCTQGKVGIDLASNARSLKVNIWATVIGQSSLSRKTTMLDISKEIMGFCSGKPLVDFDGSLEGYLESLSENPIAFCTVDECSVTHSKMGQKYNAGYYEFECKMYDGESHEKRLASGGKKEPKRYPINKPFVTKLYASTFVKYARSLTVPDFDGGYGFRFLFAAPIYDRDLKDDHVRTQEDREEFSNLCCKAKEIYDFFSETPEFNMDIDKDALNYFTHVSREFNKYIKTSPANRDLMGSAWSRYSSYILKIAALIEIGKTPISTTIHSDSVVLASSMVTGYFLPTLCDVYGLLAADTKNNKIDLIISELKKLNGTAPHSILLRKSKLESREFKSCVDTMYESEQIDIVINNSPGRKEAKTYILKDLDAVNFRITKVSKVPKVPLIPVYTPGNTIINTPELREFKEYKEFKEDRELPCVSNTVELTPPYGGIVSVEVAAKVLEEEA